MLVVFVQDTLAMAVWEYCRVTAVARLCYRISPHLLLREFVWHAALRCYSMFFVSRVFNRYQVLCQGTFKPLFLSPVPQNISILVV